MHRIYTAVILACVLLFVSCSQRAEENRCVQFDLYGTTYTINERQFTIRANPRMAEGERMKTVQKGARINFEFRLGPTEARAKKELELVGEELRKLAEGNVPEGEGVTTFDIVWFIETADPIGSLEQTISYDTPGLSLGTFVFTINVPEYNLGPGSMKHECWVEIDELTDDRVKGRFGGVFEVLSRKDTSALGIPTEIANGIFDVPLKKLYRYR